MDYIAVGDLLLDTVRFADGSDSGVNAGGPVAFGYTGLRLWTDSCCMVCNAGADYYPYFEPWLKRNHIPTDGFHVKTDYTNHFYITYRPDGTYEYGYGLEGKWGTINFGYLRVDADDIAPFCPGLKGLYIDQPIDRIFWKNMLALKKKYGFKIMWEIQRETYFPNAASVIREIVPQVDVFSINSREGREFFGATTDEEIIEILKSFETPCFFRVGDKGSHFIQNGRDHYVPSVVIDKAEDPTGCGNSSTATAMYAFCEGYSPYEIAVMANITAAYNLRQYGLIPEFSAEIRMQARERFLQLCQRYQA